MKRIIIMGTGSLCVDILPQVDKAKYRVEEFWDNNADKWGNLFEGVSIRGPHKDITGIDKIVIASSFYSEIYNQLVGEYGIGADRIVNCNWFDKEELVEYYKASQYMKDYEVQEIVEYLRDHNLTVFNYKFNDSYKNLKVDIQYDKNAELFYVMHHGKRMYMRRDLNKVQDILKYYCSLEKEQNCQSPHCYANLIEDSNVKLIIDAGCAEGNFALDYVNRASKIIIIEADTQWVEALKYTFEPYKDKVKIIQKYLADTNDTVCVTLDELCFQEDINEVSDTIIKMDIEGAEKKALIGGAKLFTKSKNVKVIACAYHNENAESEIEMLLLNYGMRVKHSYGYMFFPVQYERKTISDIGQKRRKARLRRGLVLGEK